MKQEELMKETFPLKSGSGDDLPIHSSPVLSRELPTEQVQTNEPGLLMHSPLMQGLDSHSFTSEDTEADRPLAERLRQEVRLQQAERSSDPRRRPSPSRSGTLWDSGR